jgi:hypothetical protein
VSGAGLEVPRLVMVSLDATHRAMVSDLATWLGTERFAEVMRMALRATWRNWDTQRHQGKLPRPPVVRAEARGRRRGGPKRADMLADAIRVTSVYKRLAIARARWHDLTVEAGIDPAGADAEAERWREAWRGVEIVVGARDPERRARVAYPAGAVSPGAARRHSDAG